MESAIMRVSDGDNKFDVEKSVQFLDIHFNFNGNMKSFMISPAKLYKILSDDFDNTEVIAKYSLL